jgi:hypothetical protein
MNLRTKALAQLYWVARMLAGPMEDWESVSEYAYRVAWTGFLFAMGGLLLLVVIVLGMCL